MFHTLGMFYLSNNVYTYCSIWEQINIHYAIGDCHSPLTSVNCSEPQVSVKGLEHTKSTF